MTPHQLMLFVVLTKAWNGTDNVMRNTLCLIGQERTELTNPAEQNDPAGGTVNPASAVRSTISAETAWKPCDQDGRDISPSSI